MTRDIFGLVGKTVNDKFRFDRVLGEGGYGIVYAGTHLVLSLPVAIKCLKHLDATEREREIIAASFLREARILFGLGHPNIVRLYDVGVVEEGRIPFAVLELLSGTTLAEEIDARARKGRHFDAAELTAIFLPMFEGVAFAHARGVVHRDLKPANVMLVSEGGARIPKVLDFGTARASGPGVAGGASAMVDPAARPVAGSAFTPLYAAPEQWDRQYGATGPATDVFALGLVLAEACLLGYAFGAPSGGLLGLLRTTLDPASRPDLVELRPDLPDALARVVTRALAPKVADRYADARDLLASFRTAMKADVKTALLAPPIDPRASRPSGSLVAAAAARSPKAATQTPPHGTQGTHVMAPLGGSRPSAPTGPPAPTGTGPQPLVVTAPSAAYVAPSSAGSSAMPLVLAVLGGLFVLAVIVAVGAAVVLPRGPASREARDAGAARGGILVALEQADDPVKCRTAAQLRDVANAHHAEVERCAGEARAKLPGLEGRLDVSVTVAPGGAASGVECRMFGARDARAQAVTCPCVADVVARWSYPKAECPLGLGAGLVPVEYEYRLTAAP